MKVKIIPTEYANIEQTKYLYLIFVTTFPPVGEDDDEDASLRLDSPIAAGRLKLTQGLATGGVVTLQTLGVAVDTYDQALLRTTAKTLLYGAPPEALTQKVRDILLSTPSENIRGGVLRALDAATINTLGTCQSVPRSRRRAAF